MKTPEQYELFKYTELPKNPKEMKRKKEEREIKAQRENFKRKNDTLLKEDEEKRKKFLIKRALDN